MPENNNQFHRHSVRLKGYDYSIPGAYFVTVVTYQRASIFGEGVGGEIRLNDLGAIAKDEWFRSKILRPYVQLHPEAFVVMPNHVHGIIWINELQMYDGRGAASLRPYSEQSEIQSHDVAPKSLGAIVRSYKSAVTYQINALRHSRGVPVWQRNYHEHIIRNQVELEDIAGYIFSNPDHWDNDPENTLKI